MPDRRLLGNFRSVKSLRLRYVRVTHASVRSTHMNENRALLRWIFDGVADVHVSQLSRVSRDVPGALAQCAMSRLCRAHECLSAGGSCSPQNRTSILLPQILRDGNGKRRIRSRAVIPLCAPIPSTKRIYAHEVHLVPAAASHFAGCGRSRIVDNPFSPIQNPSRLPALKRISRT